MRSYVITHGKRESSAIGAFFACPARVDSRLIGRTPNENTTLRNNSPTFLSFFLSLVVLVRCNHFHVNDFVGYALLVTTHRSLFWANFLGADAFSIVRFSQDFVNGVSKGKTVVYAPGSSTLMSRGQRLIQTTLAQYALFHQHSRGLRRPFNALKAAGHFCAVVRYVASIFSYC